MYSNFAFDILTAVGSYFSVVVIIILRNSGDVLGAAGTCTYQEGPTAVVVYCEDGCCNNDCCTTTNTETNDITLILIILAVIVGVIIIVFIIIFVIYYLKVKKREKLQANDEAMQKDKPHYTDSYRDPEKPALRRENAFLMSAKENGKVNSTDSAHKNTAIVNTRINSYHNDRRNSGSRRNSKVKPSETTLPQVMEVDEMED